MGFFKGKKMAWMSHLRLIFVLPFFHTWDLDSNISDVSWWQNLFWNQTWFGQIVSLNMPCLFRFKWPGASCCFAHLHFFHTKTGPVEQKDKPNNNDKISSGQFKFLLLKKCLQKMFSWQNGTNRHPYTETWIQTFFQNKNDLAKLFGWIAIFIWHSASIYVLNLPDGILFETKIVWAKQMGH